MFYVYEHWRPDTNVCFYVGKGTKRRAWNMSARNRKHKSVQSKLTALGFCVDVRVVIDNLEEAAAFAVERDRINFYGLNTLINLTTGGEGMSGHRHTEETKRKVSEARKGKPLSAEHRAKLSAAKKGKKQPAAMVAKRAAKLRGKKNPHNIHPNTLAVFKLRLVANTYAKGRKRSPEHIEAMMAARRGKKVSPETLERMRVAQQKRHLKNKQLKNATSHT